MAAVVSLSDIEIINLERVGFNLKNFDMAIVFKVSCWGVTGRWWESSGDHGGGGGEQRDWPIDVRWGKVLNCLQTACFVTFFHLPALQTALQAALPWPCPGLSG